MFLRIGNLNAFDVVGLCPRDYPGPLFVLDRKIGMVQGKNLFFDAYTIVYLHLVDWWVGGLSAGDSHAFPFSN